METRWKEQWKDGAKMLGRYWKDNGEVVGGEVERWWKDNGNVVGKRPYICGKNTERLRKDVATMLVTSYCYHVKYYEKYDKIL